MMNLSAINGQEKTALDWLAGRAVCENSELIMAEQKPKRKAVSKKLRFEVFKRDGFVCQYCGAHPPKVVLHVDHIDPVANGGTNHIDNLITSCDCCNLGKGARLLSDMPKSLKDKAAEAAEREEQIKGYNDILMQKMNRIENESWAIAEALEGVEFIESYNKQSLESIKLFLDRLAFAEVLQAAMKANAKKAGGINRFKYFCGICWTKIREAA